MRAATRIKQSRELEESDAVRKKRDSVILIIQHLLSLGYQESANVLANESGIGTDLVLCDNISLNEMMADFETFYELKYGKKPQLTKKNPKSQKKSQKSSLPPLNIASSSRSTRPALPPLEDKPGTPTSISTKEENEIVPADVRLMKPIPVQLRAEFGDLTSVIARDIFIDNPGVKWSDIVGLHETKRILREAIVLPLKYPQLFTGNKLLQPWKGVLLHGPPGTGKTLLAKAVAGEGTTFFNVSAATLVSKLRGDSEKLIRILFELARYHAPSTIFIDELDSIMSRRDSGDEHEASRRMKTEFLIQMDGLIQNDALVFVLAASNHPYDLDPALLRRLEKRVLVPLPGLEEREALFRHFLTPDVAESDMHFKDFAEKSEKYSGSDIRLVCKEAAMQPLRRLMNQLQSKYGDDYLDHVQPTQMQLDLLTNDDVYLALERTKPSDSSGARLCEQFQEQFGVV